MAELPRIATNKTVYNRFMKLPIDDNVSQLTYVWIDGTGEYLRSKTRTHYSIPTNPEGELEK